MDFERAKWLGLYYIGVKMRTEWQLRKKLAEKGADEELCDRTIAFLKDYHYIDDTEFARCYISDCCHLKKQGLRRILGDLRQMGIDENIISDVMENMELDFDSHLADLIRVRARGVELSDPKQKNRLVGYLMRRGYALNDIYAAIREYLEDTDE